ncbi:MAG: hypothetical protein JWR21_4153 [Herminiimonas sp.]|nr:hypothetical protein [Herminiimonas sp.]
MFEKRLCYLAPRPSLATWGRLALRGQPGSGWASTEWAAIEMKPKRHSNGEWLFHANHAAREIGSKGAAMLRERLDR